ncbi:single-stranded DNA-binding protein [Roseateles sp. GG27B]
MSVTALVTGRLLADPEQRTGPSGKAYTLARMAVQTDGEESAAASLIAFGTAAEQLVALSKGDTVAATGRCKVTSWSGRDGEAKAGLSVTVDLLLSAYHLKRKRAAVQPKDGGQQASKAGAQAGRSGAGADDHGADDFGAAGKW